MFKLRASGGFAVTESGKMFKLDIDNLSFISASLVSKTSTPRAWRSVDSSNDGEIAVAVVYGGNVHTSRDSGETWTSQSQPGVRTWIAVTVSENGKRRVALSADVFVAISSTTSTKYAYDSINSWTVDPTPTAPEPGHVWSSINSSDNFSVLLATQTNADGTSDTGRIYMSGWDDVTNTMKDWELDPRETTPARWNSVAMTRDGKRAIAGAMSRPLFILDNGDIWYRLTNADSTSRTLATKIGPKARTKSATSLPPLTILNSEYEGAYASLFGEEFDAPVYDYMFDNSTLYLVDCTRQLLPTGNTAGQMLVDEPDGDLNVFITL